MRRWTLLLAATAVLPLPATAAPRRPVLRRLAIRHAATGARFVGPWHDGRTPDPAAMADLSAVLADTRTGDVLPFDPAAIEVLWEVARRAGLGGDLTILSGYRTPQTNYAVHGAGDSQHLRAGAVDVQVAAERLPGFAEQALLLGRGGVGVYAARGFVHLDSGPVRRWGDVPEELAGVQMAGLGAAGRPRTRLNLTFDPLANMAEAWAKTRLK